MLACGFFNTSNIDFVFGDDSKIDINITRTDRRLIKNNIFNTFVFRYLNVNTQYTTKYKICKIFLNNF